MRAGRGFWVTRSASAPRIARAYFALQAAAGALWWLGVVTLPPVRRATLGALDPVTVALADIPLFVLASALAAVLPEPGRRWAMRIAVPWTLLVTAALAVYATATGLAGWGAVIMAAASCGGVAAWSLVELGRIPAERLLLGPLSFGVAPAAPPRRQLGSTLLQMLVFWALFLAVLPAGLRGLRALRCGVLAHAGATLRRSRPRGALRRGVRGLPAAGALQGAAARAGAGADPGLAAKLTVSARPTVSAALERSVSLKPSVSTRRGRIELAVGAAPERRKASLSA